jgi:L-alanine-DL-glutamate epimerase-like enolase superfamily enzyme
MGIGETYAGYFFPEVVPEIVNFFSPILIGQNPDDINQFFYGKPLLNEQLGGE